MLTVLSAPELTGAPIGWQFRSRRRAARVTLGLILAFLVGCAKPSASGHVYLTFGAGDVKPVAGEVIYLLPGTYDDLSMQVGVAFDEWATTYLAEHEQAAEKLNSDDPRDTETRVNGATSKERKLAIALDMSRVSQEAMRINQEMASLPETVPKPTLHGRGTGLSGLGHDAEALAAYLERSSALILRRSDLFRELLDLPDYSVGENAMKRALAEALVKAQVARTDITGAYIFDGVENGRYVLMTGYATNLDQEGWWLEDISVNGPTQHDLTNFNLITGTLLEQLSEMARSYLENTTAN